MKVLSSRLQGLCTIRIKDELTPMDNRPKMIVLPLQPDVGQAYNGIGLGIHFLLGNMIVVYPELAEFWFGWRVKKIFKRVSDLSDFCRGKKTMDIPQLAKEQEIRFWLSGRYAQKKGMIQVSLLLYDADHKKTCTKMFRLYFYDFLVSFAHDFLEWLGQSSLPLDHRQMPNAVWKEDTSIQGLEYLGRALERFYQRGMDPSMQKKAVDGFEKAVNQAPESYLAHDLEGWNFYKNQSCKNARQSFKKALEKNAAGVGAIAGMIGCHVCEKNREKALAFSMAKADVRNDPHDSALEFIEKKFPPDPDPRSLP